MPRSPEFVGVGGESAPARSVSCADGEGRLGNLGHV